MIGTPYYMSPEQGRGKGEIDHRADLYSLGVVLYELFVGQVPFSEGTPYTIITDHVQSVLPMPSSLNPNVPPAIEIVLLRALSKEPDDRYQNAQEILGAVRDAVKTEAPQISILSQGRQSAADSIAHQMAADANRQSVAQPERSVTPTRVGNTADTRKSKKTAPMPATPAQRRFGAAELGLLAVALVLIFVLVLFALRQRNQGQTTLPTLAVQQPSTLIVTLPPRPTESPTLAPTVQPSLPPDQQRPEAQPGFSPPPVPTLPIPQMSEQAARDILARDPGNPGAYLALAKAQLQANQVIAARETLADGLTHFPDAIVFEMTAASMAVDIGRYDAAFLLYADVLQRAEGERPYPAVRATAGEYLYQAATLSGRLTPLEITFLAGELESNRSPVVSAMIGRAFVTSGNLRLADAAIGRALSTDSTLAEAHLVNGELKRGENDPDGARSEWELVLSAADAPQWVRDRAAELIDSLN
jgi:tetratricopeptide (TPR) repeat protein